MAVSSAFGFECEACGTHDTGWDDYAGALRAEIAHLEKCSDPDAPDCLEEARERLAEITGEADAAKLARQARVPDGSPLRCGSHMRHRDESTELCVLHKDHRIDDTDCVDRHGCRRPPMFSQSTREQARYWQEELNRDA